MKTKALLIVFAAVAWIHTPVAGQKNPFKTGESFIPRELVTGRTADIRILSEGLEGELLSVSTDSLWVLSEGAVRGFSLQDVQFVDVHMHNWDSKRVWSWNLLAGLGSTIAMGAACSTVEDAECGSFLLSWSLSWLLFGGISAGALANSSRREVHPNPDALRPYVRFPQGMPAKARSGLGPRRSGG
jgi:hypothetical protein